MLGIDIMVSLFLHNLTVISSQSSPGAFTA